MIIQAGKKGKYNIKILNTFKITETRTISVNKHDIYLVWGKEISAHAIHFVIM